MNLNDRFFASEEESPCMTCGAQVKRDCYERHNEWHEELEQTRDFCKACRKYKIIVRNGSCQDCDDEHCEMMRLGLA